MGLLEHLCHTWHAGKGKKRLSLHNTTKIWTIDAMHKLRNRRLRALISRKQNVLQLPGAFNALTAKAIEKAGFEAVYVSGAGLANAVFALPDVGLVTMTEAVRHARQICSAVSVPVMVDGDTGFGEAVNVARTVAEMEAAGVSAIHFEDQVLPKKCGHLDGKELIPAAAMIEKLRAACAARRDPDFMIIARTDARGVTSFADAVERAGSYLDAGADAIFPEALRTPDEMAEFAARVKAPLIANMTEFGKTPLLTLKELARLGYRMVIYPQTALRVAFGAVTQLLTDLKGSGDQKAWLERMQTRAELYDLLGYDGLRAIDKAATSGTPKRRRGGGRGRQR
jgi:methylisocitrate lyase